MSIKLAHFELMEEIGHGGLGIVFRAFDPSLKRQVAIKILKDDFARDETFVQDFLRESQNAAAISHPHIAQVHFVGEFDGNYYMVMELVNGRSLEQMIIQDGPVSEAKALKIAIEITEALKAAYVNQMIHGDIKPQNIVVGEECGAKLLDFGLAQLANVEAQLTDGDKIWGSPYYISPERVGKKAEDFRSDIYSLGATIFELLVGRPPFDAADPTELALKRLNEKPPLLRTLNPNLSKRTEQIIDKMLQKNVLMRYVDYNALLTDLHKAEAGLAGKDPLTDTMEMRRMTGYVTAPVVVPTAQSQFGLILAASLASCILVGGLCYYAINKKTEQTPAATAAVSATPTPSKYGSKIVRFHYQDTHAHNVRLVGNFDQWQPEEMKLDPKHKATWFLDKEISLGSAVEYQFEVDGKRIPDPTRETNFPDGKGSFKSVFDPAATPKPTATPTPKSTATPSPTPATPSPSASPSVAQTEFDHKVSYIARYLANFRLSEANREISRLTSATPAEEKQKTLLKLKCAAQMEFKQTLEADVQTSGYPFEIQKRNKSKLTGGIYKTSSDGVIVSDPAGEVTVKISDLAPHTLLDISRYFTKNETDPGRTCRRQWTAAVTAANMGLKDEAKALMKSVATQQPDLAKTMDDILEK